MKVVIIGNHAAGLSAAQALRAGDRDCEIVVLSREDCAPYSRCLIPYLVSGEKTVNEILHKGAGFYGDNRIDAKLGVEVLRVLPGEKVVLLAGGQKVSYDALIIASGGQPSLPRLPGVENAGVFCFRALADAQAIAEYAKEAQTAVVLGGGLVGLKAAVALRHLGKSVKVMVGSPHVLSQIVAAGEAEAFEEHLRHSGIEILTRTNPAVILGKDRAEGVETTEGTRIACQLVIVGKGVDAKLDLVADSGISTEYGILVDDHCRTSVSDVYAAGDVAQVHDSVRKQSWLNTLWPHAVEEGRVAAENVLGLNTTLRPRTSMNSFVIGELAMMSCGLTGAREEVAGSEVISVKGPAPLDCRRFVLVDNRLVGYVLVGNVAHAGLLTALVVRQIDITNIKEGLAVGRWDLGGIMPLIRANRQAFPEPEFDEVLSSF